MEGRSTYQVDLLDLDCYGNDFDMTRAERVEFGTRYEAASTVDIEVFSARFVE